MLRHLVLVLLLAGLSSCIGARLRISGGDETTIQQHPYQVAIDVNGTQVCGGAILNKRWVVTSSPCFLDGTVDKDLTVVRVGAQFREQTGEMFSVAQEVRENLVVLLQVDADIDLGTEAKAIDLVDVGQAPAQGEMVVATGYGDLYDGEQEASGELRPLQAVAVPVVAIDLCSEAYYYDWSSGATLSGPTVCAGSAGKGICSELDYGDPLVNWKGQLVGVAYVTPGCGRPGYPSAFIDLSDSDVQKFIKNTITATS